MFEHFYLKESSSIAYLFSAIYPLSFSIKVNNQIMLYALL